METKKILIAGEIGTWYAKYDKEALFYAEPLPLDIFIDSQGGSVTDGNSFAAIIRNHATSNGVQVRTIGIGLVASIATSILLAGSKVEMDAECLLMIHNPSVDWFSGDADAMRKTADTLDVIKSQLVNMYLRQIEKNGKLIDGDKEKTRKKVEQMMNEETWLSAQQAVDFGLVDSVVSYPIETKEAQNLIAAMPAPVVEQYGQIVNKAKTFLNKAKTQKPTIMDKDKQAVEMTAKEKTMWEKFKAMFGFSNEAENTPAPVVENAPVVTPVVEATKSVSDFSKEELEAELAKRNEPAAIENKLTELQNKLVAQEKEILDLKTKSTFNLPSNVQPLKLENNLSDEEKELLAFHNSLPEETRSQLAKIGK